MPLFDFTGYPIKKTSLRATSEISKYLKKLAALPAGYGLPDEFINLTGDKETLPGIAKFIKEKVSGKLGCVVVLGIGGSAVGAQAVYTAVKTKVPIIFFNNVDPDSVAKKLDIMRSVYSSGKYCLVNVISKSGSTIETAGVYEPVVSLMKQKDKKWRERVIAVTYSGSPLQLLAEKEGFGVFLTPRHISGRYSFFGPVGLLPLGLAGVNVTDILSGARAMQKKCLSPNLSLNPAARGALAMWQGYKSGKIICNNFIFSEKLIGLAVFSRDIFAESLGKDGRGITPLVSIGTTDLHALGQLYFGGPKDKFTVFMRARSDRDVRINSGRKIGDLMDAIYKSVLKSYKIKKMPYYKIDFSLTKEKEIGEFMIMKMFETVFLGQLMGVNPFNQPAVELYKKTARQILNRSV